MKNISLLGVVVVLLSVFSSCSKCYECTRKIAVEVDTDGDGVLETEYVDDTDDVCTADSDEIDNKESQGYTCS
tara:strand:- start:164 stop:382 length:219 start_codon:yes stop_codon:yes gene_type:complete